MNILFCFFSKKNLNESYFFIYVSHFRMDVGIMQIEKKHQSTLFVTQISAPVPIRDI